jgi:dipeptide/tripeptide permease
LSFIIYILGYTIYPILAFNEDTIPNYCFPLDRINVSNWMPIIPANSSLYPVNDGDQIVQEYCSWLIIVSIVLIGIGSGRFGLSRLNGISIFPLLNLIFFYCCCSIEGSVKSNLAPFGADQVRHNGQNVVLQYFNWLYWVINFGSLCSLSVLAYIQQNENFFVGFLISFLTLVLAFVLFFTGLS